ncbi:class I SAM-dependent methyltransferase [Streptomyces abyssomicinicus]|uniref:class I SAM-dependent methyltransferase n=1 Tax=Streptomyces abyssomicinicus TaxID=574929 RepID=UPI00124F92EC|nr:class I SAM-dependent methyltransferase [Streptomyces abyssomicinicus]
MTSPTARPLPASLVTAHAERARSFNSAAAVYAAARPTYPPVLFDAVEELSRRPLAGARVVDVGAGTGISTALLRSRGARVLAVEPGEGMAAEFRRALPATPLVRGDGNHLPLASATVDLVTYAQSWHWTDPAHAHPEAMRVLHPGGALALWWNTDAQDVPWIAEQADRVRRHFGDDRANKSGGGTRTLDADKLFAGAPFPPEPDRIARRVLRWSRRVPLDTHLANVASHSLFIVHGEESTRAFLDRERARLREVFPDGLVEEVYDVLLLVVTPR